MFCFFRQLSIFLLVNIFAEKGHFEDEKTDLTSLLYGIYKIPWNKMRVLNEDLELDFTSHTERYDKLIIDLVSTHLVHMLKMIPTGEFTFLIYLRNPTSKILYFKLIYLKFNCNISY